MMYGRRWSAKEFLRGLPPVTRFIFISAIVVFLAQFAIETVFRQAEFYNKMINVLGLTPEKVLSSKLNLWQLFTYMFLHSTQNWLHIIFNMFVLVVFAPEVERAMGARRFSVLYFGSGIFGGFFSTLILYFTRSGDVPIIGASGAIMGVLAAYGSLFPNRILRLFLIFPMKAKHLIMLLTSLEVINVFIGLTRTPPTEVAGELPSVSVGLAAIASIAHLGGFLAGFLFMRYEWTLRSAMLRTIEHHYDRERESDRQIRERVDEILMKVNNEGLNSLTWRERNFLRRASRRFKKIHSQ